MSHSFQKSFTLIEIIVVTAISLLVATTAMVSYRSFSNQKQLDGEVQKVVDVLELAKKEAAASDISAMPTCGQLSGYQIIFASATQYSLQLVCADVGSVPETFQSYTLSSSHTFVAPSAGSSILFKVLSGGTTGPSAIIIKSLALDKCIKINVINQGSITTSSTTCP